MHLFRNVVLSLLVLFFISNGLAQEEKKPRISPKAGVTQIVGLNEINISYSRPGVKERTIWGELVPYGKVWRAGADEATKFTFKKDVTIEGKKLSAGSYSFFAIPQKNEWTLIFNKVADQWGAFEYNESEDALKFTVKPQTTSMQEWLTYTFSDMKPGSAVVNLIWEKVRVSFKVESK